jgi:D-glycero-D-manno-heptose 1,7-bisphosphate phosphatase
VIIYLKNSSDILKNQLKNIFSDIYFESDHTKLIGKEVLICEDLEHLPFNPIFLIETVKSLKINEGRSLKMVRNTEQPLILINEDFSIKHEGPLSDEYLDGYQYSGIRYIQNLSDLQVTENYYCFPMGEASADVKFQEARPALFLDRDGIINVDHGYVFKYEDIEWKQESIDLIKWANSKNYFVFVLTNQSGVSQGLYTEDDVNRLHKSMNDYLILKGAKITSWYYGPYSYKNAINGYKFRSLTRKPGAGMMLRALSEFNIDLLSSIMVGDKISDHLSLYGPSYYHLDGKYDLKNANGTVLKSLNELHSSIK